MLTKQAYIELYEKYEQGLCSKQEIELLESYPDDFLLRDGDWDKGLMGPQETVKNTLKSTIQNHIRTRKGGIQRQQMIYKIAAAAIVCITLGLLIRFRTSDPFIKNDSYIDSTSEQIQAGGFRATLTLEDGTQMDLEELNVGELVVNGQVVGSKTKRGQLAYQGTRRDAIVKYHTIETPRGGEYQIDLPDGSKVWLNAASSIRFPTTFSQDNRTVKITGEVYFQVAKDKNKPFIVDAGDQQITVLGTKFNVNAYDNEQSIQTSLLEGKVTIKSGQEEFLLVPGQRATYNKQNSRMVTDKFVDGNVLAWQRDQFVFDAENLQSILRKIERWYDVEVIYKGEVSDQVFSGNISRLEQVDEVLNMLALTGMVSFETKGRRIYVLN
ncbi:FecR family protein [Sphingobacterium sp. JB170]|uniref:FecR family protein n=1 Tax=Sphingobacterium sp. JB170 TaxID=1434842 RepID=UPI00097EDCA2|nr:FecR domain-containing protein [Sphingobacterium sp. JB170]SJN35664.1 putative anti-sigma factor [Sphingobacterium sp. JB170]